jgi:signal transduction histidine kinase
MLHLGRPEQLPFVAVAIDELANQTAAMARHRATAPTEIAVRVEPDLQALGSYDELHQVLLNLCINAVDAMPQGGRLVISGRRIALDREQAISRQVAGAGSYVEITVADNGCGMDEATLSRAFEPFFTTKPRNQGTGLGLAMIHSTIRRHHGAVEVSSVVGYGTTFRIVLPLHANRPACAPTT